MSVTITAPAKPKPLIIGSLITGGLTAARRPRTVFVRATVVLTALSLVPDALAATATKVLLMLTHVVAAAIVIPVIARRLSA
jgi:hypothetical protein